MLPLRIDSDPEVESVTRVWLGPLCVGVVLAAPIERVAPYIAAAFSTYGQGCLGRRLRRDAGPRGTQRWLKRHEWYFEDLERRRQIRDQLTPFVEAALNVYA